MSALGGDARLSRDLGRFGRFPDGIPPSLGNDSVHRLASGGERLPGGRDEAFHKAILMSIDQSLGFRWAGMGSDGQSEIGWGSPEWKRKFDI